MLTKYCAVIFDFDGTLYDNSNIAMDLILQSPFEMFKMHAERKVRHSMKGIFYGNSENYLAEKWNLLCKNFHFKTELDAKNWYYDSFLKKMINLLEKKYSARKSVQEIFKKLKSQNIKLAVFSDYPFVKERMEAVGLQVDDVDIIQSSEELGGLKPAKESFEIIAKKLGFAGFTKNQFKKILVVGDRNDTDGQGARNVGMDFIQIKTKKTKEKQKNLNHKLLNWNEFIKLALETEG